MAIGRIGGLGWLSGRRRGYSHRSRRWGGPPLEIDTDRQGGKRARGNRSNPPPPTASAIQGSPDVSVKAQRRLVLRQVSGAVGVISANGADFFCVRPTAG